MKKKKLETKLSKAKKKLGKAESEISELKAKLSQKEKAPAVELNQAQSKAPAARGSSPKKPKAE